MNAVIPFSIKKSDSKECIIFSEEMLETAKEIVSILKKNNCTISQANEIFQVIITKSLENMDIADPFR